MDYWEDEIEKYNEEVVSRYLDDYGDEFASEYFEDHIKEFTRDRLRSYFLQHPDVIMPAASYLAEAKALLRVSPRAALVFASGAIEFVTKYVILRPLLQGLVHVEEEILSKVVDRRSGGALLNHHSILEFLSFQDRNDHLGAVEAAPMSFGLARQHEGHRQRGFPATAAFRSALSQSHRRKCGFDWIRRP